MTPEKTRRCKALISQRDYYRNRAYDMGELYGSWIAESLMCHESETEGLKTLAKRFYNKMVYYAKKQKEAQEKIIKEYYEKGE